MSDAVANPRGRARVTIESRPLWRLRLGQRLSRALVLAGAAAGALAFARVAIAPPRPEIVASPRRPSHAPDPAASGFASLFARAYLSWREGDPEARRRSLEPFVGAALSAEAGAEPLRGSQRVLWEQVVQEREPKPSLQVYTVAVEVASARTSSTRSLYLAVSVLRRPDGRLALASYPAFVGPPASSGADPVLQAGAEIVDPELETVVARALRNYLAPAPAELAADLVAGTRVSTPRAGLRLQAVQRLTWAPGAGLAAEARGDRGTADAEPGPGRTVLALIDAAGGGADYTLAYEVEVQLVSGRWEVGAIETDPDS